MTHEEIHEMAQCLDPKIDGKAVDPDYICNDIYDFSIGVEGCNEHNNFRVCGNIRCDQLISPVIHTICIPNEEADKHNIKLNEPGVMVSVDAVYKWLLEIEDGTIIMDAKQFADSFLKDIKTF